MEGEISWGVSFACREASRDVAFVRTRLRQGSCTGPVLYEESFAREARAESPPPPGALGPGIYGFEATAITSEGQERAVVCVESPLQPRRTVELVFGAGCSDVAPVMAQDAGMPPMGLPPPPTLPDAAGRMDAALGLDAGDSDAGNDGGVPAAVEAGTQDAGACPDEDRDGDNAPDCEEACPDDPSKQAPGMCGCGVADTDLDADGTADCIDLCPSDRNKTAPGVCGCGRRDTNRDADGDGTVNCLDACPRNPSRIERPDCGCDVAGPDGVAGCMLAHWAFEANANDSVGGFHGEELDGVAYVAGPDKLAVDLTRTENDLKSHVRVASDAPDAFTPGTLNPDDLTLAFWMQGSSSGGRIIERGRPCLNSYSCVLSGTELTCDLNAGGGCGAAQSVRATLDPTQWNHVTFTVERSADNTALGLRLYINGELADSLDVNGSFPNNTSDQLRYLVMGRNYFDPEGGTTSVQPFAGLLDDVRIYEAAMTPEQVASLHDGY